MSSNGHLIRGNLLYIPLGSVKDILFDPIQDESEFGFWVKLSLSIFLIVMIILAFIVHHKLIVFLKKKQGKGGVSGS
jgi:hypothetical protein